MTTIPGKKRIKLPLGGVERDYMMDLAALSFAEEAYGEPMAMDAVAALKSFRGMRAIIYGGFRRCDATLTVEKVDDQLDMGELAAALPKLLAALADAMPQEGDVPLVDEGAAKTSTRRSSTSTSRARKTSGSRARSGAT